MGYVHREHDLPLCHDNLSVSLVTSILCEASIHNIAYGHGSANSIYINVLRVWIMYTQEQDIII